MSKENNNEAKVIDMTATENENMVEISAKELNDLQESNANLIADRVKGIEFHPVALNRVYKNTTVE